MFEDLTTRDHKKLPVVDLYVAGFPCQPFSMNGKRRGTRESRGKIIYHVIDTIRAVKPRVFILENVSGLLTIQNGKTFQNILDALSALNYTVDHCVLNTIDYGIPQNRERVFIIGRLNGKKPHEPFVPPPTVKARPIGQFLKRLPPNPAPLGPSRVAYMRARSLDWSKPYFISGFRTEEPTRGWVRTLMTHSQPYLTSQRRYLTARECLNLQGFPEEFKIVVSETQAIKQAGNAMSVPVVAALIKTLLL
jgi:DNA (cytosine-5)-methyltransferase 1